MRKNLILAISLISIPAFAEWQSLMKLEANSELFIDASTFQKKDQFRSVEVLLNEPQERENKSLQVMLIVNCQDKKYKMHELRRYEKINAKGRMFQAGSTDWMSTESNNPFAVLAPVLCSK